MSMIANFKSISPAKLKELKNNPEKISDFLYQKNDSKESEGIDIDKSWDGIHYLLNGCRTGSGDFPLSCIIEGRNFVSNDSRYDLDYGPVSYATSQEVKEIYNTLSKITEADLKKRFDPDKIKKAEVYSFENSCSNDDLDYFIDNFKLLKNFYKKAAEKENVILQYYS